MAINPNVKFVQLESTDKMVFVVSVPVAMKSRLIRSLLENMKASNEAEGYNVKIPVTGEVLGKAVSYCEKHTIGASSNIEMQNWDMQFVDVDPAMLDGLLSAANYLKIDGLKALVCQKKADMAKG